MFEPDKDSFFYYLHPELLESDTEKYNEMEKDAELVDDVNEKVESLNGLFQIVDFTTDKLVSITDKVIDGVSSLASRLFFKKKKNKEEDEENE